MSEIYQFSRSFIFLYCLSKKFSAFFRAESDRIYIFADKFGCRGSTNKKSPTTRYRYSRIYPYCVFLFYTPVTPNKTLTVKNANNDSNKRSTYCSTEKRSVDCHSKKQSLDCHSEKQNLDCHSEQAKH